MAVELEAKWVNVDFSELRNKLKNKGAKLIQPERLMKRVAFDFSDKTLNNTKNAWVRVRDEGDKITISYKQVLDRSIYGTNEISIEVDSFDQAIELVKRIGLHAKSYQETKRETWVWCGVEITLDVWPWLPPMIEIESDKEDSVWSTASALGLDKNDATHGSVENVYAMYYSVAESEVIQWPEIKFVPLPDWLQNKIKIKQ